MKVLDGRKAFPEDNVSGNMKTALKSAYYMPIRHIYNHPSACTPLQAVRSAVFLFIRNYAYSGMFRHNSTGGFNVPYGGMEYNRKNLDRKIDYLPVSTTTGKAHAYNHLKPGF